MVATPGPQTLQTKEDTRPGGGEGQTWASRPPALLYVLPPRTVKDLDSQKFLHGLTALSLHCLGVPSPTSVGLLDTDPKSNGDGPSLSRPTQSPLSAGHKGPTQAAALHSPAQASTGRSVPGASTPLPGPAWGEALTRFLPARCQRVWPDFKPQVQAQTLMLYTTPCNQPPFLERKEKSRLSCSNESSEHRHLSAGAPSTPSRHWESGFGCSTETPLFHKSSPFLPQT